MKKNEGTRYRELGKKVLAGGLALAMTGAFVAPAPAAISELAGGGAQAAWADEDDGNDGGEVDVPATTRTQVQQEIQALQASKSPTAQDVQDLIGDFDLLPDADQQALQATYDSVVGAAAKKLVAALASNPSPSADDISDIDDLADALDDAQRAAAGDIEGTLSAARARKTAADQKAASPVQAQIAVLLSKGNPTDEEIAAAGAAYDALSEDQKKLVSNAGQLQELRQGRQDANQAGAEKVQDLIYGLQENDDPTPSDIERLQTAYDALAAGPKSAVVEYDSTIAQARAAVQASQEKAAAFETRAAALVNGASAAEVAAARTAYDSLTRYQKSLVGTAAVDALEDAEAAQNGTAGPTDKRQAAAVQKQLDALAQTTRPAQSQVDAVKAAYGALSAAARALLPDAQATLVAAQTRADSSRSASAVQEMLDALAANPTPTEKDISDVQQAYAALSDDQKKLVSGYEAKMTAARGHVQKASRDADASAAKGVQDMVDALAASKSPTRTDIDRVVAAYANLTASQKKLVSNYQGAVDSAEAKIASAASKADRAAAQPVNEAVAALAKAKRPSQSDIDAVKDAYGKLTDSQKRLVTGYATAIAAAEKSAADWKAADAVQAAVDALASNASPSQADIDAVNAAYAGLTVAQKDLVKGKTAAVTSAQQKIAAQGKEAQKADAAAAAPVIELAKQLSDKALPTQADVDAVKAAYGKLTASQKKLVLGYDAIVRGAESRIANQKDQSADKEVARIQLLIDDLIVNTDPKQEDVDALVAAYGKLTDAQKKKLAGYDQALALSAKRLQKKQDDADQKAADAVARQMNDLAWDESPTRAKLEAVKQAYNGLTDAQKKKVKGYDSVMASIESAIASKEGAKTQSEKDAAAAAAVQARLSALDAMASPTQADIDAAVASYETLTSSQKKKVEGYEKTVRAARDKLASSEDKAKADQARTDAAAAQAVRDKLAALAKDPVQPKLDEAKAAYDALTDAQKKMVVEYSDIVEFAESKMEMKPAYAVQDLVDALAKSDAPKQKKIDAAKAAYAALTGAQKKRVSGYSKTIKAAQKRHDKVYAVKSVTVNAKTVSKSAVAKAVKKADRGERVANAKTVVKITIGSKARKLSKGALSKMKKATTLVVKSSKLSVARGALSGSKVRTVQVKVGKDKGTAIAKYRAAFAKSRSGKSVKVR